MRGDGKSNERQSERRKQHCQMCTKECEWKSERGLEQRKRKSKTLPLRQRAERNGRGRQSRALLSHNRTKGRGASWESEPCAAADAMLDGSAH